IDIGVIYLGASRKLPSGRWQARVRIDGKYVSIGMFDTKKEADIHISEVERKLYYNETITDRKMKFQEVIDDWFRIKKGEVKGSTLEQLEVIKRLHIEPFFGNKMLFDIKRDDVLDWVVEYGEREYE